MLSILIAVLITPVSCILLWNRMIVTVDAFIHACILSSVVHIKLGIPLQISMMITALLFVIFFQFLELNMEKNEALQLISMLFMNITLLTIPSEFKRILIGSAGSIDNNMIYILIGLCIILYLFFYIYYNKIILFSLNSQLYKNLYTDFWIFKITLLFLVCAILSTIIEYTGTILLLPFTVIPGITSRNITSNPKHMFFYTLILNVFTSLLAEYISNSYLIPQNRIIILIHFIILSIVILQKKIFHIK